MFTKLIVGAVLALCVLSHHQSNHQLAVSALGSPEWTELTGGCLHPASLKKGEVLAFTSPEKVLKAIEQFEKDRLGGTCGPEYEDAFQRLKWVLDKDLVLEDICGLEAYERIRAFHLEFIHFYVPELNRDQLLRLRDGENAGGGGGWIKNLFGPKANAGVYKPKPIPEALRQFFINFVKQISAHCKQRLVYNFDSVVKNRDHVNAEDYAVINTYKGQADRLKFMFEYTKAGKSLYGRANKGQLDEIEMIDWARASSLPTGFALESEASSDQSKIEPPPDDGSKLYLQVPFDDKLWRIKRACERRFMPVYMELFAPVIRLNNLGYIDRVNSDQEDEKLDEREEFSQWFVFIQTCEVIKDIEIFHDASPQAALMDLVMGESFLVERNKKAIAASEPPNVLAKGVKLLSREEAERLDQQKEQVRPLYDPPVAEVEHQKVAFTGRMWLTESHEVQRQARELEGDLNRLIRWKTSLVKKFSQDLWFQLKLAFRMGKKQVVERDELSMLGRIAIFIDRHKMLIRGIGIIISIIVICVALA